MKGKQILKIVAGLKKQKDEKEKAKTDTTERSLKEKEAFYNCKTDCKCKGRKYKAAGLKECPNCHNILK